MELLWDGKYRDGRRAAPTRIALPFQTVETVNESARDRERTLDLFATSDTSTWKNRLIWGDKKYVLPSLREDLGGKVDLIYIDPPFETGSDFSFTTSLPESDTLVTKEPSAIEIKAYRDTWAVSGEERARGVTSTDKYSRWFADTATLLRDLLSERGLLFVHLDDNVSHEAKLILDEIFGRERFRGEIIWTLDTGAKSRAFFSIQHNTILVYSNGDEWTFNHEEGIAREPFADGSLRTHFKNVDEAGRPFRIRKVNGKEYKYYADKGRLIGSVWRDISSMTANSPIIAESTGYPTQKPEKLLSRIIGVCSRPGDLVLDCFCGSGTTLAVAETLGRRWVGCDLSRFAIHTTRKRLLSIEGLRPFVVQNLGKYERGAWASAEFVGDQHVREHAYRRFILDLYRAEPFGSSAWIHGLKAGRFIHVGAVDAPVTASDIKNAIQELARISDPVARPRLEVLGWEFAFELNETAKQLAAAENVDLQFRRIPGDVLDPRAVAQGDIQEKDFLELRAFTVSTKVAGRDVSIELSDFMMPTEDLPEDIRTSARHWSQWVDYWAIDWDYRNDTFHNQWQSYRAHRQDKLDLLARHQYPTPGTYIAVVKVIDLLGCDTTKTLSIQVE